MRCAVEAHPHDEDCGYRVAWSINPHMNIGATELAVARTEHERLVATLRALGAQVCTLPFVHGAFDSVFTKDNAILVAHPGERRPRALLARPLHDVRRKEQAARAIALARTGFELELSEAALEGGDVVMLPRGGALLGCGPRSSAAARTRLARFLDAEVYALPLRDPRLYHLDTALTVLADGTALVCRQAFETSAILTLAELVARGVLRAVLDVPYDEALRFAVNVVEIGDAIVTGTPSAVHTNALLARLGKRVIPVPLGQFHHAGGSAACLVACAHSRVTISETTAMRSAAAYAGRSSSSPKTSGSISA